MPSSRSEVASPDLRSIQEGLGPAIEALRIRAGLSRAQLAEQTHLGRSTILKIEKGERAPSPQTLQKIASKLGFDPDSLLAAAWIAAEPNPEARRTRAAQVLNAFNSQNAKKALPVVAAAGAVLAVPSTVPTALVAGMAAGIVAAARRRKGSARKSEEEILRLQLLSEISVKSADELKEILSSIRRRSSRAE